MQFDRRPGTAIMSMQRQQQQQQQQQHIIGGSSSRATLAVYQCVHRTPHHRCAATTRQQPSNKKLDGARGAAPGGSKFKFNGVLRYATQASEANAWLNELLQLADSSSRNSPVVVGYDAEAPVLWQLPPADRQRPTALMQLCYHPPSSPVPICLLLQLSSIGAITKQMQQLLEHPNVLKVGVGMANDLLELQKDFEAAAAVGVRSAVDLNQLARVCGVLKPQLPAQAARQAKMARQGLKTFDRSQDWSLKGLLQALTGLELAKNRRITTSNWGKVPLSDQQIAYAATDAYTGLVIFCSLRLFWMQQQQTDNMSQTTKAEGSSSSSATSGRRRPSMLPAEPAVADQLQQLSMMASIISAQVTQPDDQHTDQHSSITVARRAQDIHLLTSSSLWQVYEPEVVRQKQWQKQVLTPVCRACKQQLARLKSTAAEKQAACDGADWLDCATDAQLGAWMDL